MIRLRSAWFQIHKWLGIVLAILIIPISLTGSALVWHDWLDEQINPQRYAISGPAALAPSAYAEAANRLAQPGERLASISFPDGKGSVQTTLTKETTGGGRPQRAWVFMNPQTGDPIERASTGEGLVRVLHGLHGSLLVPGMGRQIVGWVGLAMLISALTGIWLWWPIKGSFTRGLRWKRRPDFKSNLHHTGGFWIALPLAVLSLTGVWISFPAVFAQFNGPQASAPGGGPGGPAMPLAQPRLRADEALSAARKVAPGQVASLAWPTEKKAEWTVMLKGQGAPTEVKVKESNASASISPKKPETRARTMRRIHDGTGRPLVWQIIIFVGGILPAALTVTGILMWLRMRRRRQRHRRNAGLVEAGALAN